MHWSLHGKVPLEGCDPKFSVLKVDTTLGCLIQEFMAPLILEWCRGTALFVPKEKLGVREKKAHKAEMSWPLPGPGPELMRKIDYCKQ